MENRAQRKKRILGADSRKKNVRGNSTFYDKFIINVFIQNIKRVNGGNQNSAGEKQGRGKRWAGKVKCPGHPDLQGWISGQQRVRRRYAPEQALVKGLRPRQMGKACLPVPGSIPIDTPKEKPWNGAPNAGNVYSQFVQCGQSYRIKNSKVPKIRTVLTDLLTRKKGKLIIAHKKTFNIWRHMLFAGTYRRAWRTNAFERGPVGMDAPRPRIGTVKQCGRENPADFSR